MKRQPTVYVIDDDPAILHVLAELIGLTGLNTKSYASATEFLEAYEATSPACLVLDVRLPGMSGPELQQRLAHSGNALPIIFITGHADAAIEAEAMKHGAIGFLEKPFRPQDLIENIQKAIALAEENWQSPSQSPHAPP